MKTFALAALAPLAFAASAVAANCPTLESREPEGKGQRPTFEGQTRACAVTSNVAFDVTVVASGASMVVKFATYDGRYGKASVSL